MEFVEVEASKKSLYLRSSVYGVGTNDAKYMVELIVKGEREICPYYKVWAGMLQRCYYLEEGKNESYAGCTVCDEWLMFSSFKAWMEKQDWQRKQLDKDLLIQGNKEYNENSCIFVTQRINLLVTRYSKEKKTPIGVSFNKRTGKYVSYCSHDKIKTYLGSFNDATEAFNAYKEFKYKVIAKVAEKQTEPLRSALLNYKII